ncbi:MAG: ABC transporter ATP-binding protein [Patescibacteria group bacterium]
MKSSRNALSLENLCKTYKNGVHALNNVNLELFEGDFFALLGPNGAGKTTLIGVVTGLVEKNSGDVRIFGIDPEKNPSAAKQAVGVVPQEFNFNIFEKVLDIVVTQAGYFGIPKKEAELRAEKILTELGLWDKKDSMSMRLSGGMKRRLLIARGLIHDPQLLILDEPTAGVDVELRHGMWKYLTKLNKEGKTILLTTHYLEEAEKLSKRVAIIQGGEIIREGNIKELIRAMEKKTYLFRFSDGEEREVIFRGKDSLMDAIEKFKKEGKVIVDLGPKMNPLEELFLDLLQKDA